MANLSSIGSGSPVVLWKRLVSRSKESGQAVRRVDTHHERPVPRDAKAAGRWPCGETGFPHALALPLNRRDAHTSILPVIPNFSGGAGHRFFVACPGRRRKATVRPTDESLCTGRGVEMSLDAACKSACATKSSGATNSLARHDGFRTNPDRRADAFSNGDGSRATGRDRRARFPPAWPAARLAVSRAASPVMGTAG